MKYLFNELKPKGKAHFWDEGFLGLGTESDTYCHMWSTGGLNKSRPGWIVQSGTSRDICTMCENNRLKQYRETV